MALENVTDMFSDRPDVVKGIFKIVLDESVDKTNESEEEEGQEATAEQQPVKATQDF